MSLYRISVRRPPSGNVSFTQKVTKAQREGETAYPFRSLGLFELPGDVEREFGSVILKLLHSGVEGVAVERGDSARSASMMYASMNSVSLDSQTVDSRMRPKFSTVKPEVLETTILLCPYNF